MSYNIKNALADFKKEDFLAAVERTKEYIANGDCMQYCLCKCDKDTGENKGKWIFKAELKNAENKHLQWSSMA